MITLYVILPGVTCVIISAPTAILEFCIEYKPTTTALPGPTDPKISVICKYNPLLNKLNDSLVNIESPVEFNVNEVGVFIVGVPECICNVVTKCPGSPVAPVFTAYPGGPLEPVGPVHPVGPILQCPQPPHPPPPHPPCPPPPHPPCPPPPHPPPLLIIILLPPPEFGAQLAPKPPSYDQPRTMSL